MTEAGSGRVSIEEGVVVGRGGDRELKADVFTPPPGTSNGVGLLLVHGGGWVQGDRSQLRGYGILLGRIGYTCVTCEYRLAPASKWPAQIHDVKAALRWMRANAEQLNIDPRKIAVSGNSAGGHLSLIVAGTPNIAEFEGDGGNADVSTDVAACIAYYGPALLYSPERELPQYLNFLFGDGYSEATAKGASPLTHVSASFPPTMLITGNKDELVPPQASFMMYQALLDAGASAELHVYADAPHGFDAISEFGRQTATLMSLFLDRYVVRPRTPSLPVAAAASA
jgi:acetyl esterase/lipase